MHPRLERAWTVLRAIVHEIRTEKVTFLAGSIAYHAFVSLLPLLLLLVLLLSALGDLAPTEAVFTLVSAALTDNAADLLIGELRRTSQSRELSIVGGGFLVWGTLRVFRGLDTAFSDIYETEENNGFLDQLGDGVVVFLTFALAVVAAGTFHSILPTDTGGFGRILLGRGLLAAGLTLTLLPMYYLFPDTDVSVPEVLPGTVFTAVGLTAFESAFRVYLDWSGNQPDGSVLAVVLVFLTWLYVSGFVVLIGAVVNAVLSNRSADVSIEPVIGGVRDGVTPESDPSGADIDAVERLFEDTRPFSVNVGEESVDLPAPQSVVTGHRDSTPDSTASVEFRWPVATDSDGSGSVAAEATTDPTDEATADDTTPDHDRPPRE